MKNNLYFLIVLCVLSIGCTKPPDFSPIPEITFNRLENNNIRQDVDSVYLIVDFTDGDGDIGFEDNTKDIFLIDTRPGQGEVPIERAMPTVPNLGAENGITGEIRLPLTTCCIPPPGFPGCQPVSDQYPDFQRDTVVYMMYIQDRAGNRSNTVTLEPIYLRCD